MPYMVKMAVFGHFLLKVSKKRDIRPLYHHQSTHLKHHPVKFGVDRPCENNDIMFLICHVTTWLMVHVTLYVSFSHPKSSPC